MIMAVEVLVRAAAIAADSLGCTVHVACRSPTKLENSSTR